MVRHARGLQHACYSLTRLKVMRQDSSIPHPASNQNFNMPTTRVPPLLEPYINPTPDGLTVLTGVLGAGTNWLVVRHICAALGHKSVDYSNDRLSDARGIDAAGNEEYAIVLVSWMRDWEFWRQECRRSGVRLLQCSDQPQL